ncbi:hypothetical protein PGT21_036826 [Puccinia graminis f. sp. tritici]|uniref:RRM domain-containing protein n=1 Tax=Puccinia graminis f. sp. tritici TaxID=56615 RepID=A0A5B0R8Z4_PUCGR|nr:hypothetical protein PGT21_036826 [Puccinia graminis f. sp. tritici]KAA1121515.1 hypothetical protein PGTUg99_030387 [Puccinia graminis f. sp. tritici]
MPNAWELPFTGIGGSGNFDKTPHDFIGFRSLSSENDHSPPRYFQATQPWPILLSNLAQGKTADDLRAALACYGPVEHCFLFSPPLSNVLCALVHYSDYKTAAAAAADLDDACADGETLTARLMSSSEQEALVLLRRIT